MKLSELFSIGRRFGGSMSTPGASVLDGPVISEDGLWHIVSEDGQFYLSYANQGLTGNFVTSEDGLYHVVSENGLYHLAY